MSKEQTPLAAAVAAFDDELAAYSRLGELFLKTQLSTLAQLERANATLGELAACEQRLQTTGQHLVQVLSAARERQEQLANEVVAHAPTVQARNQQLADLMSSLAELAREAARVNASATSRDAKAVDELSTSVLALSERSEALAKQAHEADFEELANQAHALHQRLLAIGTKLQKAAGN
jgi:hypothetical protein